MFGLYIYLLLILPGHEMQVAVFKFSELKAKLSLEVSLERNDFLKAVSMDEASLTKRNYNDYITKHLSVDINERPVRLRMDSMIVVGPHYKMYYSIHYKNRIVSCIKIENTCLLEMEGHSNIVELRINNKERDFLMDENRTIIDVGYR